MKSNFLKRESSPCIPRLRDRCLPYCWRVSLQTLAPLHPIPRFTFQPQHIDICTPIMFSSTISPWILDKIPGYGCSFKLHRLPLKHLACSTVTLIFCSSRKSKGCISSVAVILCTRSNLWLLSTYSPSDCREIYICRVPNNGMKAQPRSSDTTRKVPA